MKKGKYIILVLSLLCGYSIIAQGIIFDHAVKLKSKNNWRSNFNPADSTVSIYTNNEKKISTVLIKPFDDKLEKYEFITPPLFNNIFPLGVVKSTDNVMHWIHYTNDELLILSTNIEEQRFSYSPLTLANVDISKKSFLGSYNQGNVFYLIMGDVKLGFINVFQIEGDLSYKEYQYDIKEFKNLLAEITSSDWQLQRAPDSETHLINTRFLKKIYPLQEGKGVMLSYETKDQTEVIELDFSSKDAKHSVFPYVKDDRQLDMNSVIYKNYLFQINEGGAPYIMQVYNFENQKMLKQIKYASDPSKTIMTTKEKVSVHDRYSEYKRQKKTRYKSLQKKTTPSKVLVVKERTDKMLDLKMGTFIPMFTSTLDNSNQDFLDYNPVIRNGGSIAGAKGVLTMAITESISNNNLLNKGAMQQIPVANGAYTTVPYTILCFDLVLDQQNFEVQDKKREETVYDKWIKYQHNAHFLMSYKRKDGLHHFKIGDNNYFGFYIRRMKKYQIVRIK